MAAAPAANATITNVFSQRGADSVRRAGQRGAPLRPDDRRQPRRHRAQHRPDLRRRADRRPRRVPARAGQRPGRPVPADHALPRLRRARSSASPTCSRSSTRGYATFSMTTRGFGQSCGTATSRTALGPACNNGYVRLMDTRYEVRDAQELAGLLADEGRTSFTQIGAIGGSYGGGMSMALAALKDRKMLPGRLARPVAEPERARRCRSRRRRRRSPGRTSPTRCVPNGGTLDYVADAPYQGRTGVLKSSWENALYNSGPVSCFYAPAGLGSRRRPAQLAHRLQRRRALRRRERQPAARRSPTSATSSRRTTRPTTSTTRSRRRRC